MGKVESYRDEYYHVSLHLILKERRSGFVYDGISLFTGKTLPVYLRGANVMTIKKNKFTKLPQPIADNNPIQYDCNFGELMQAHRIGMMYSKKYKALIGISPLTEDIFRIDIAPRGKMPHSKSLPIYFYKWWKIPNILDKCPVLGNFKYPKEHYVIFVNSNGEQVPTYEKREEFWKKNSNSETSNGISS